MPYYQFFWTAEIVAHLAENNVTPEEFEDVVSAPASTDRSQSSARPMAFGFTDEGRYLVCVYEFLDAVTVLPVTAFEPERDVR